MVGWMTMNTHSCYHICIRSTCGTPLVKLRSRHTKAILNNIAMLSTTLIEGKNETTTDGEDGEGGAAVSTLRCINSRTSGVY